MDYKEFTDRLEKQLPILQEEYRKHAEMHKKNARFWLFATWLQIILLLCLVIL